MEEMKHLFIINPKSFAGQEALDRLIAGIEAYFVRNGRVNGAEPEFSIRISRFPRHAAVIIDSYMRDVCPGTRVRIYSIGGEGHNFSCLNGIVGLAADKNVELAIMPYGATNDFALLFGKEHLPELRNAALQAAAPVIPVDVIRCNGNYALNGCTVGLEAASVIKTAALNRRFEKVRRKFLPLTVFFYTLGGLLSLFDRKLLNQHYTLIVDGEDLSGTYVSINIANGPFYGGGKKPVADAVPDDGWLNAVMLKKTKTLTPLRIVTLMGRYFKGEQAKFPEYFVIRKCREIYISSDSPLYVNLDGEAFFDSELWINVVPGAVKLAAVNRLPFSREGVSDEP